MHTTIVNGVHIATHLSTVIEHEHDDDSFVVTSMEVWEVDNEGLPAQGNKTPRLQFNLEPDGSWYGDVRESKLWSDEDLKLQLFSSMSDIRKIFAGCILSQRSGEEQS